MMIQHPKYPTTRVAVWLPRLGFHFSPARFGRLMRVLREVMPAPPAAAGKEEEEAGKGAKALAWQPGDHSGPMWNLNWTVSDKRESYECVYTSVCVGIQVYFHAWMCVYECMYVWMHVCLYVCMYVGVYVCTFVWIFLDVFACVVVCVYVGMHAYVYTCLYIWMSAYRRTHTCV